MPSQIPIQHVATKQTFTITLASLAAAAARQATLLNNNANPVAGRGWPAALIWLKIKSGAVAPAAGKVYEVYLIRGDDPSALTLADDGAGTTDAAITIENANLLGTIIVTNTAAKNFYGVFDTSPLGPLGPYWGIAIKNATDQALDATEANHVKEYMYYDPEAQ